ncbi:MAG: hypothetical protein AAF411_19895 [Myxococcota bacterium]
MSASFTVPCTVRITVTAEELSAHVELDGDPDIGAGDRVHVQGEPMHVSFGESRVERRQAVVVRASLLGRAWAKFLGHFECLELLEVSFSDRRTL